jgi:hypothetical protein
MNESRDRHEILLVSERHTVHERSLSFIAHGKTKDGAVTRCEIANSQISQQFHSFGFVDIQAPGDGRHIPATLRHFAQQKQGFKLSDGINAL